MFNFSKILYGARRKRTERMKINISAHPYYGNTKRVGLLKTTGRIKAQH